MSRRKTRKKPKKPLSVREKVLILGILGVVVLLMFTYGETTSNGVWVDLWTIWHIVGGVGVGLLAYNLLPETRRFEYMVGAVIIFEVVEQNLLVSWFQVSHQRLMYVGLFHEEQEQLAD